MTLRPCLEPRCGTYVESGRCPVHAAQYEHQRGNWAVRRWYRTARWRQLRRLVLTEEPTCRECAAEGRPCEPATDVHHIDKHGGDFRKFFDRNNLRGMCHAHHARYTQRGE